MVQKCVVFGAGYVGIPTAILFAEAGWDVVLVESSEARRGELADAMEAGTDLLGEPELGPTLRACRERVQIVASADGQIRDASIALICVGTPLRQVLQGNPKVERVDLPELDHTAVRFSTLTAWREGPPDIAVVVRSTCSPLFVHDLLLTDARGRPFAVVPEFLREGTALADARNPSRLVVGNILAGDWTLAEAMVEASTCLATQLCRVLGCEDTPTIFVRPEEAAAAKLAANALLTERVAFGLRLAALVERELPGCDAASVVRVLAADPRIGTGHLGAGLGAGGPCLPKDSATWNRLVGLRHDLGSDLIAPIELALEIRHAGPVDGRKVLVWGLGFKPSSPDWRDSPALRLVDDLARRGMAVYGWDPRLDPSECERALSSLPSADVIGTGAPVPCPVVVLCTREQVTDAWLQDSVRDGLAELWDPYALLGRAEARYLVEAGVRYHGGGRGAGWATG